MDQINPIGWILVENYPKVDDTFLQTKIKYYCTLEFYLSTIFVNGYKKLLWASRDDRLSYIDTGESGSPTSPSLKHWTPLREHKVRNVLGLSRLSETIIIVHNFTICILVGLSGMCQRCVMRFFLFSRLHKPRSGLIILCSLLGHSSINQR